MQDRVPKYPNRVMLKPVEGQPNTYDLVRADEPIQEGTPLNKGTLLDDSTCILLGLNKLAVPNTAFQKLFLGDNLAWTVTLKTDQGDPMVGIPINGLTARNGNGTAVTNEDGVAIGITESNTPSFSVTSPYVDYENFYGTFEKDKNPLTYVNIVLKKKNSAIFLPSSSIISFSPYVSSIDITLVGGGGGGAGNSYAYSISGGGGGGGYVSTLLDIPILASDVIRVVIGGGGAGGAYRKNGGTGGTSTLYKNDIAMLSASGGLGGKTADDNGGSSPGGGGNGSGGAGSSSGSYYAGGNGGGYLFNDAALGTIGGGGGGGGTSYNTGPAKGGSPNGGAGGNMNLSPIGGGYGGGGGGEGRGNGSGGARGGSGGIYIRGRYL